jgi:hypothetical protein
VAFRRANYASSPGRPPGQQACPNQSTVATEPPSTRHPTDGQPMSPLDRVRVPILEIPRTVPSSTGWTAVTPNHPTPDHSGKRRQRFGGGLKRAAKAKQGYSDFIPESMTSHPEMPAAPAEPEGCP